MAQQTYGEWMRSNPPILTLTAVEWLQSKVLYIVPSSQKDDLFKLFEQAKAMEKQQKMDAYGVGKNDGCSYMIDGKTEFKNAEQYYNETYDK